MYVCSAQWFLIKKSRYFGYKNLIKFCLTCAWMRTKFFITVVNQSWYAIPLEKCLRGTLMFSSTHWAKYRTIELITAATQFSLMYHNKSDKIWLKTQTIKVLRLHMRNGRFWFDSESDSGEQKFYIHFVHLPFSTLINKKTNKFGIINIVNTFDEIKH